MSTWPSSLNCTDQKSNLTCMREASVDNLIKYTNQKSLPFGFTTVPYDNVTNPSDPAGRKQSGKYAKVPVIGGTVANEGTLFSLGSTTQDTINSYLNGSTLPHQVEFPSSQVPNILSSLPASASTPFDNFAFLQTLLHFQCPMSLWTNQSAHLQTPTWRYYYNATFANLSPDLAKFKQPSLGAWHTSEIPLVFGTYPGGPVNPVTKSEQGVLPTNVNATDEEIAMGKFLQGAWARFARDPKGGPGWDAMKDGAPKGVAYIGADNKPAANMVDAGSVDAMCAQFLDAFRNGTGSAAYGVSSGSDGSSPKGNAGLRMSVDGGLAVLLTSVAVLFGSL